MNKNELIARLKLAALNNYSPLLTVENREVLALVEALESAQEIRAAAEKLVRCKGRYHSEQNYRALAALFGVTTPDLPPMSEDAQTVVVIPPAYVDGNTLGYGEVNHMIDLCVDSFERACHAAGIKCEVKGE